MFIMYRSCICLHKEYSKKDPDLISIVSSKMLFEKFFIDFHNSVNYRLGKPLLPESVARKNGNFNYF